MASSALATAFVNIVPGTAQLETYLKGGLGAQMAGAGVDAGDGLAKGVSSGFGSKIKGYIAPVLGGLVASFAAVQIKDFLAGAIKNASDFGESANAIKVSFGDAAIGIAKLGQDASTRLGLASSDFNAIATQFSAFSKTIAGPAGDAVKVIDDLTTRGADFASVFNLEVKDAMALFQSGLAGESEPLRKYGIDLSAAAVEAQALEMGIGKVTKTGVKLTEAEKVQARYAAVMEQTAITAGDFANTSDGLANQQRILDAQTKELSAKLGDQLLPIMAGLAKFANETLVPALENIGKFFVDFGPVIGTFVGVIVGYNIAMGIFRTVTDAAWIAQMKLNLAFLANPMTYVVIAIAALVAGIVYLATKTTFFQDTWKAMTKWVSEAWANVTKFLSDSWNNIIKFFTDAINFIVKLFLDWTIWGFIIKNWGAISKFFSDSWNNIVKFFGDAMKNIGGAVSTGIGNVIKFFQDLPGNIITAIGNVGGWLLDIGKNIIDGLLKGLGNAGKAVGEWFKNMGTAWINQFKSLFGIASPSKVFKEFGKNIMQGLRDGLAGEGSDVAATMKKVGDWLTNAFADKKISTAQLQAGRKLVAAYGAQLLKLEKEHTVLMEKLDTAQKDLADKIAERADYIKSLSEKFGSALTIDTTVADQNEIAAAKNDLAKAQENYNKTLADTEKSLTDIEDARLSLAAAEKKLAKAQNPGTTATSAIAELKARIAKSKQLKAVTDQLLALGLDKKIYKQIVETQAIDFGESIIAGGIAAVNELNVLSAEADVAAVDLATKVGDTLFAEGIKFAEAVVAGLEADKTKLEAVMDAVAAAFEKHMLEIVKGSATAITTAMTGAAAEAKAVVAAAIEAAKGPIEMVVKYTYSGSPLSGFDQTGGSTGRSAGSGKFGNMIAMASGGFVTGPTPALVGEAGPEVVTPLKDFERMLGLGENQSPSITYIAAPNQSLDSEQALFQAMKRAKAVAAW